MIIILLITFLSGGNYFVMLLFWPTQVYNVYGKFDLQLCLRTADRTQVMNQSASEFAPFPSASASLAAPSSVWFLFRSPKVASVHS
jgi:hypothetical protein